MSAYNCFGSELSVPTIYITSVEKIYMGDKSNKTVDPWQHGCYSIANCQYINSGG